MKTFTVTAAARFYGRTPRTIRRWCRNGTLLVANCRILRNHKGAWLITIPLG